MKPWAQFLTHGSRTVLGWVGLFALWALWLALAAVFVFQLYILSSSELAIPEPVLRHAEARLEEAGLRARFGRTSFDPTGRVLIENIQLSLPGFPEPIAKIRAAYAQLNPLALAVGIVRPSEIRVIDAQVSVPAQFSPSGRPEEVVSHLQATLEPSGRELIVHELSANILGVHASARGSVPLPAHKGKPAGDNLAAFLAQRFPALCKQAITARDQLVGIEAPTLRLHLAPSESGALRIGVTALSRAIERTQPAELRADRVTVTTNLLLFGETPPIQFDVVARELRIQDQVTMRGVHASVQGRVQTDGAHFDLREVTVTADAVEAAGVDLNDISAVIHPQPLPALEAAITTHLLGEPLALRVEADLGTKTAHARFTGNISPRVLDVISARVGTNVRRFYDFEAMTAERAEVNFGAGWKFEKLTARLRIPRMNSYGVIMEDGLAVVELDPERFYSPQAFARIGENFARGTYEHNLKTHEYRFLLDGRLQPLAISHWFHDWWPDFFKQLQFVSGPPEASVDVQGRWRGGDGATVFVFADVGKSILRGAAFDRTRTRIFIRPAFFDGLELLATHDDTEARGRFMLLVDPISRDWQTFDFAVDSTLDLKLISKVLGPIGTKALAPIHVAQPPELKLAGTFYGTGMPPERKDHLRIEARTVGDFKYQGFPLPDASFVATLDGDDVVLDNIAAAFGGGSVSGHARVWGPQDKRRLGFDLSLQEATLGEVVGELQGFFAAQKGQPPPPPGKFVTEKAGIKIDFAASAEGLYTDPMSYRGDGNIALRGGEIGEVQLLGALSDLFKFTSLRFTEARGNFKIDGAKISFPKVEARGANSALDAHGDYALDKRTLDFNVKVFPFQESDSLLKSAVGVILTPLSNVFEVKLGGSLDKPEWRFANGPSNFLRSLTDSGDHGKPATSTETNPAEPAKTPPPTP